MAYLPQLKPLLQITVYPKAIRFTILKKKSVGFIFKTDINLQETACGDDHEKSPDEEGCAWKYR